MAKIKISLGLIFAFIALVSFSFASDLTAGIEACPDYAIVDQSPDPVQVPTIDNVIQTYRAEIGVRELTGNNDGDRVETYLKSTDLGKGYAWCAAFVNYAFSINGIKTVDKPAWSPSWFSSEHLIYKRDFKLIKPPAVGDIFGIYFKSKKRIAHVGFIDEAWNNNSKYITTVEGNTNGTGDREGDGVYRKRRLKRQIYAVSSHFV
jgi:hypothetical protein